MRQQMNRCAWAVLAIAMVVLSVIAGQIAPTRSKVQVWTALITMLLLKYLQMHAKLGWSLSNLVALLRMNLFVHHDLWAWLNKPFEDTLALWEVPEQEALAFG